MKPMRRVIALVVLAAIGLATVIGLVEGADASTIPTYHQAASGRSVKVAVGDKIRVDLRAPSGTAYRWVVVRGKHSSKFAIVSRRTYSQDPGVPGGLYHTVWTLKGTEAGRGTFKVVLRDAGGDVARRFTLYLRVINPDVMHAAM